MCISIIFTYNTASAQISDSLYRALSADVKPINKANLTNAEKRNILTAASNFNASLFKSELHAMVSSLIYEDESTAQRRLETDDAEAITNFFDIFPTDSSIFYVKRLITENLGGDRNFVATMYLSLSVYYSYNDQVSEAMKAAQTSENLYTRRRDTAFLSNVYDSYQLLYSRLHLYDKAIYYCNNILQLYPTGAKWGKAYITTWLQQAALYSYLYNQKRLPQYRDSAYFKIQSLMLKRNNESAFWFSACYYLLGYLSYTDDNYSHALNMLDSSMLPAYNRTSLYYGNHYLTGILYKGACLVKLRRYAEGEKILKNLNLGPRRYGSKLIACEALGEAAEAANDYKKALFYHKKYNLYADSLNIEGQQGIVFEAEQKYLAAQKEADISRLENENLKQKDEKRGWIISLLIAVIILLLLYLYYRRKLAKRASEAGLLATKLQNMEKEMWQKQIRLLAESEQALTDQRQNISRDMHDEVGSSISALLFLIKNRAASARSKETKSALAGLDVEAMQVYVQVREFMHRLNKNNEMPPLNVVDLLFNLPVTFGTDSSLRIYTEYDEENIERYFTAKQHAETYLFIKEAVSNCMKHAAASRLFIKVTFKEAQFYIDIKDNGNGITNAASGIGIMSMQERIESLGGESKFISAEGMQISATFPAACTS